MCVCERYLSKTVFNKDKKNNYKSKNINLKENWNVKFVTKSFHKTIYKLVDVCFSTTLVEISDR